MEDSRLQDSNEDNNDDGDDDDDDDDDLHGCWKNWYDGEHVLERVNEVGEGEHWEGEGVDVPGLQHHLALQQDQADHLQQHWQDGFLG